uniref:SH3 domain-containing protein n=1 Tax=Strigamia maritima TaxID=126957 RepID=T1JCN5_STRMM
MNIDSFFIAAHVRVKDMATLIKDKSNVESDSENTNASDEEETGDSNSAVGGEDEEVDEISQSSENEKSDVSEDEEPCKEDENASLICKAMHSYNPGKKGYLMFEKGDEMKVIEKLDQNWIKVENRKQEVGLVPLNYVTFLREKHKTLENNISDASTKSGKDLWQNLKLAVKQSATTDVLNALGAMPSGFRISTLHKLLNENCMYTLECALAPKLSSSNLGYCHFSMDSSNETLQVTVAKVQRTIRLVACKSIPLAGAGVDVLSRHVYACLFDGSKIISNIHRVSAKWDSESPKLWSFATKSMFPTPCNEDANILIRSRNAHINLGVLFEVCISLYRTSSGEHKEMSCGWVFVKLFDAFGLQISSGTYNLKLQGGSPLEHGIAVDSSIGGTDSTNPLKAMVTRFRQPTLAVKISRPETRVKNEASVLPPTFIAAVSLVQFFWIYRQILAETLLKDKTDNQNAELIYSPVLSQFPSIASQSDLVDIMRTAWMEQIKSTKRSEKSKPEYLKRLFTAIFMDNMFIYNNINMPPYSTTTNIQVQQSRNE